MSSVLDAELLKVANLFGGEEAVAVTKVLKKLGEATDEKIANESTIRMNTVRKILYKLYDHGLVACTRLRDEKTGWYLFLWKLQPEQVDAFIRSRKRRILDRFKRRLEFESNHSFFACPKCQGVRLTFEQAMETAFRCPNCTGALQSAENPNVVKFLTGKINQIEEELRR